MGFSTVLYISNLFSSESGEFFPISHFIFLILRSSCFLFLVMCEIKIYRLVGKFRNTVSVTGKKKVRKPVSRNIFGRRKVCLEATSRHFRHFSMKQSRVNCWGNVNSNSRRMYASYVIVTAPAAVPRTRLMIHCVYSAVFTLADTMFRVSNV